ncbi:aldehyde dehydrogenase family protein [Paeniglutamicibacter sp. MACA_103]|uniref:aldehyde dehydrogenase family protein n=1 Tax=Paeniglutamicibacter sp. MACA_103 TaxID=3377337 RepID=UPI003896374D
MNTELVSAASIPASATRIAGKQVVGDGENFDVVTPIDGSVLGSERASSPAQVQAAVRAAAAAQPGWAATPADERARILLTAVASLRVDIERLSTLIMLDNGKTRAEAQQDVYAAAALLESAAEWARRVKGTTLVEGSGLERFTWREPVGVVAIFMPFNAPLMFSAMKAGAAIAVGNTVVVKSPMQNPYAAAVFADHLADAGVPAGVYNVLQGGADVGEAMVDAPELAMVSFTGSSDVGAIVGQRAVAQLKRLILELGGKSANVVFDDAPFDAAVDGSLAAIFRNSGQRCFSGSRLLLQEGIAEKFLASYVEKARSLRVGSPFDDDTQVGALITAADVQRVHAIVEQACAEGATVLCGGELPTEVAGRGAYYPPTVIDCTLVPNATVLQEEVFGPVVAVQRFATEDEAVTLANSTRYALAGGCWSADFGTGLRMARRVDAGMYWINSYAVHGGVEVTIGGRGASGFGQEMGEEGILAYTNVKTVLMDTRGDAVKGM